MSQVCGLKWSPDDREIASGGNDNQLYVWGLHSTAPTIKFGDHTAAVKAIAWSPHQHGLLASGGGTADRCIRFWNTATASALSAVDTGAALVRHAMQWLACPGAASQPAMSASPCNRHDHTVWIMHISSVAQAMLDY